MRSQTEGLLGAYAASLQLEGSRGKYQTRENADKATKERSLAERRRGDVPALTHARFTAPVGDLASPDNPAWERRENKNHNLRLICSFILILPCTLLNTD